MAVSEAMVADLYASPAKPGAILVTIEADGVDPIRVTSWPRGLTSKDVVYSFAPFTFAWAGAGADEPSRDAKLAIGFSAEVLETVRLAQGSPTARVERVRVAAADVVEKAIRGARVAEALVEQDCITITVKHRDYAAEPACQARYVKKRTPALF